MAASSSASFNHKRFKSGASSYAPSNRKRFMADAFKSDRNKLTEDQFRSMADAFNNSYRSNPSFMCDAPSSARDLWMARLLPQEIYRWHVFFRSNPSNRKRFMDGISSSAPSNHKRFKSDGSSSTPSIQKTFKYDVFLSFRGEDTRRNFVDHLYSALEQKGIETYKDDEKIKKGNKICDELIRSIGDSKLYIIVFSKNYASSSWCLDELVKIMECHKATDHTAYPVFYDVEPTEVRKQSGAVGKAFAKHENKQTAAKWREALKEAADLAGWELKNTADRHEAKFIQKIIEELSLELRDINFSIDEKLVGMETRINNVLLSLGTGSDDARMIGIKGMGGGGKTTLARVVYDKISSQFEGKSFVENVREVSKASLSGLKSLQKQILSDVLNDQSITVSSVHDGKMKIKKWMSCKKVLLVLDDVNEIEQLEALAGETNWFKSGSRIIITTRDEQVLVAHGVKWIHNIQLLLYHESIDLFNKYAFGRVIPNLAYKELSQQVVHYAHGLPLTIKVLGSFLCGQNEPEWKDALKRLETIPLQETLEILEISYDSLEKDYKEIFLNVACIMKGFLKAYAIEALESCGFHAINGLRVLEQKSLITVNWSGRLVMHDHIEEMAKNIVRGSHPDKPNKHSRLWIDEEIEDIFDNDLGTEATRYIRFNFGKLHPESMMKGLSKMEELRFLHVRMQDINATKSDYSRQNWEFNQFPNALQYLSWFHYPFRSLPETFQPDNLVKLNMYRSRIVQLWEGGEKKVLKKLRFLDLSYSDLRTLDLGLAPNLEKLNLEECLELIKLCLPRRSENLRYLKLIHTKLKTLDVGLSPNLEYLNLRNCHDLEEFHMADGCLKKLVCLDLSGCVRFSFFRIPTYIDGSYYRFTKDCASSYCTNKNYNCDEDDDSRGGDESLEGGPLAELHLIAESLERCPFHPNNDLPKFRFQCYYKEYQPLLTRNLKKLISDGLCACTNLDTFFRNICGLPLRKLELTGSILEAPKDLGQLGCLEKLQFSHTNIKHLPDNICMLKHLKSLEVVNCLLLEKLPEDLGRLECLMKLTLAKVKIKDLPDSICMLKHLDSLELDGCWLLEKLPENLGRLECLKYLNLRYCKSLRDIPDSICKMKCLKYLEICGCTRVEKLPDDIGRLECLEKLTLTEVKIKDLPDGICMLKHLEILKLEECWLLEKLPEDLGQLECLNVLNIRYCESLRDIPDSICNMKSLIHSNLRGCT